MLSLPFSFHIPKGKENDCVFIISRMSIYVLVALSEQERQNRGPENRLETLQRKQKEK